MGIPWSHDDDEQWDHESWPPPASATLTEVLTELWERVKRLEEHTHPHDLFATTGNVVSGKILKPEVPNG